MRLLIKGCGELSEAPIYIDDSPGLTPLELRAKARRLKSQHQDKVRNGGLSAVDELRKQAC